MLSCNNRRQLAISQSLYNNTIYNNSLSTVHAFARVEFWLKIISKIQTSVNNWKWGDKTWLQCFVIFLVVLFYPVYKLVDILEWLYWLFYYFGHIIQYIWTKYFLYNKQLIFIDNIFQWAHNSQVFRFSKFSTNTSLLLS